MNNTSDIELLKRALFLIENYIEEKKPHMLVYKGYEPFLKDKDIKNITLLEPQGALGTKYLQVETRAKPRLKNQLKN